MSAEKIKSKDPLEVAGDITKLLLENEKVRVLDVRFKPGVPVAMHSHPDHLMYVLDGGRMKLSSADGKSTTVDLKAGQAIWMPAVQHAVENIGEKEVHNLVVELKK
jgi:beta-alanine degradation protein BauB